MPSSTDSHSIPARIWAQGEIGTISTTVRQNCSKHRHDNSASNPSRFRLVTRNGQSIVAVVRFCGFVREYPPSAVTNTIHMYEESGKSIASHTMAIGTLYDQSTEIRAHSGSSDLEIAYGVNWVGNTYPPNEGRPHALLCTPVKTGEHICFLPHNMLARPALYP